MLTALGLAGNWLSVPVAYGVSFIFGSIFTIIVVGLFGMWWGLAAALIASSYTYLLWAHPYAIIIFAAEILWIGAALRKNRSNILLIDALFWLLPGLLLVFLFYGGVMRLGVQSATIIYLKQGLNGVLNALVASAVLSYVPVRRWLGFDHAQKPVAYSTIFLHVTAGFVVIPMMAILLLTNYRDINSRHESICRMVDAEARGAERVVARWLALNSDAVRAVAGLRNSKPPIPLGKLQEELARGTFTGYALGAINPNRLHGLLREITSDDQICTILDERGFVVVSTAGNRKPLDRLPQTDRQLKEGPIPGVFLAVPGAKKNISVMDVWKDAFYFTKIPVTGSKWTLLVEYPIAPLQKYFYDSTIKNMSTVAVLLVFALIFSSVLSRMLARAPALLAAVSRDIPGKLQQQEQIPWPTTKIAEISGLIENFKETARELGQRMNEAQTANERLENRVRERTEELHRLNERFRLAADAARFGVWDWDVKADELVWDTWMFTIHGLDEDGFKPHLETWSRNLHPDDVDKATGELQRALSGEAQFNAQFRVIRPDGEIRHIRANAVVIKDDDGNPMRMIGINYDVTDSENAAQELRLFKSIIELSNEAIAVTDPSGRFVYINSAHEKLFGRSSDEAKKSNYRDYYPVESIIRLQKEVAPTLDQGQGWEGVLEGKDASGRLFPLWERADSIRDRNGKMLYGFGLMHDVSEQRRAELALQGAYERLRVVMQSVQSGIILVRRADRVIVEANPAAARIVGASVEELIGKVCNDYLCPAAKGRCPVFDMGQEIDNTERTIRKADGAIVPILKTAKKLRMEGEEYLLESFVDISDLKRAEQELRASEQNFRAFFLTIDDMIVVGTLEGRIICTNPALVRKLGYDDQELSAMHILDLHPKHVQAEAQEIIRDMIRGERSTCPLPLATRSGVLVPVETRVSFGCWNGEECIFGISKDLTAEQEAQARFETLFRNNPALMAVSELPDRRLVDVNDTFLKTLGYVRSEVIGRTAKELGLFSQPEQQQTISTMSLAGSRITDFELQVSHKDGSILDGLFSGEVISGHGRDYFLTVMVDVTERKRIIKALHESEEKFRSISSSAQDAIIMMDSDGRIIYWNEAAQRIFGYNHDEAIGRDLHSFLVPAKYQESARGRLRCFQEHGEGSAVGKTLELSALRKDGIEFPVELSLSSVRIRSRWVAIGILRDISERKQSEERLRQTNRQLEEATARANEMAAQAKKASIAKSEFLANMSHEIRTPINGVIGMTGLLLDTELTEEQWQYADMVRSSGESLLSLINDILDFSKIEAKKLSLEPVDFDLQSMMDDLVGAFAVRAHEKRIEISCSLDSEISKDLHGDAGRLRQIFTNLIGNAIKFTEAGEVSVRGSVVQQTREEVLLYFSVVDTGIGIPGDKMNVIFDKFSQVDGSITRQYGGTGLGLAISKQLTELMGGEIGVKSEVGKGSEFWFTARFGKQHKLIQEEESVLPAELRDTRVLVVEAKAASREVLVAQLTSWGLRPSVAQDGPAALQKVYRAIHGKDAFTVVIIDPFMPDAQGEDLTRAIKADKSLSAIRIVALTPLGSRLDVSRLQEIGFAGFLTKPVRLGEMKKVLWSVWAEQSGMKPPDRNPAPNNLTAGRLPSFADRNVRVLLVEDNITNQRVALGILRKLGLSVDAVADGAEAIKVLETKPYDLVLMDVQMPVMDGFEATLRIRDAHSAVCNHDIPIVAMTAHALQGDREKCLETGMNDYIAKPVAPATVAAVLDKWLPKKDAEPGRTNDEGETGNAGQRDIAPLPVFDWTGMMDRLMDDVELVRQVAEGFVEDITRQIELLQVQLESANGPDIVRLAHSIKGAAANVGGERLRAVALQMENDAQIGQIDSAGAHLAGLKVEFYRLRQAIEEQLQIKKGELS
jgi:PAS domain S-box-containing protein